MMKGSNTIFLLVISFLIHNNIFSQSRYVNEGITLYSFYYENDKNNDYVDTRTRLDYKIWFKDSLVIYECKTLFGNSIITDDGEMTRTESHDVTHYTLLNITNMTGQDYKTFTDTSQPFCNFKLDSLDFISWKFYNSSGLHKLHEPHQKLTDTIIKNRVYSRLKYIDKIDTLINEYVYYVEENSPKSIFHINASIDNSLPNANVTRLDLKGDQKSPAKIILEFRIMQQGLNEIEKSIFNTWGKNAAETKLPVFNNLERLKFFGLIE